VQAAPLSALIGRGSPPTSSENRDAGHGADFGRPVTGSSCRDFRWRTGVSRPATAAAILFFRLNDVRGKMAPPREVSHFCYSQRFSDI